MKLSLFYILFFWSLVSIGQSFLNHPTIPCKNDSLFNILDLEPVIQGVTITDTNDIIITGTSNGINTPLPGYAINGAIIDLSYLHPATKYGMQIYSKDLEAYIDLSDFIIYDFSGKIKLQDNALGVDTALFCKAQKMEVRFQSNFQIHSMLYFVNYGDGTIDTLTELEGTAHRYYDPGTFDIKLSISSSLSECSLTYNSIAKVRHDYDLRIGKVTGDTVSCINDKDGIIELFSYSGGIGPKQFALSSRNYDDNMKWENLGAGYYKVTIKDSVDCIVDSAVRVANPNPILPTYQVAYPRCDYTQLGEIIIEEIKGGWGEYSFKWNNVIGANYLKGIDTNSTTIIQISDNKECSIVDTIVIDTCSSFLVDLEQPKEEFSADDINVYPNPSDGIISISSKNTVMRF